MKQIIIILPFLIGAHFAHAQVKDKHALYYAGELSFGNYVGLDLSFNYIYNEEYAFKVGFIENIRKSKSTPEDYSSGLWGVFSLGLTLPYDLLESYQIGVGKIYNLNQRGTIRLNASIGLSYTIIREPENWERFVDGSLGLGLTENYTWNYNEYRTVSLIVNPKVEFPFTRFYGLTISPVILINKDHTYVGLGVGQMLGLLREKTNNNKTKK